MTYNHQLIALLERIAVSLEQLSPPSRAKPDFSKAQAFVWRSEEGVFQPVEKVSRIPLKLLRGVEPQQLSLLENTRQFAASLPANNALLWGARGAGKSSLVKAVHADVCQSLRDDEPGLKLIEIHREDIDTLPICLAHIAQSTDRFIVFCDDLSFDDDDTSYKSLKSVLEGGIEGRPDNVLFYATSNRRHLVPRTMVENQNSTAIHPSDDANEKVSLSDRFGLWIGFHNCSQDDYLAIVNGYAAHFGLSGNQAALEKEALEWSRGRGARSGRVAWQFIQYFAGKNQKRLRF